MADWQRKLKLNPEWDQCKEGEITPQELAASIAAKLEKLEKFNNEYVDGQLDDLICEFQYLSKDTLENLEEIREEFDEIMNQLYDWGDIKLSGGFFDAKKVCWIDTF